MELSQSDINLYYSILNWEEDLLRYEQTEFEALYEKIMVKIINLLPEKYDEKIFNIIDEFIFQIHATIQNSEYDKEFREDVLKTAIHFNPSIEKISELKKLPVNTLIYLDNIFSNRLRTMAQIQGGSLGLGRKVLEVSDLPLMLLINLRNVQQIATVYGNDINAPTELMLSLKVFHAATLPKRARKLEWVKLFKEVKTIDENLYFFDGDDCLTDITWLQQPLTQIIKLLIVGKIRQVDFPFISVLAGSYFNSKLFKQVNDFSRKFYQKRLLLERKSKLDK
ncbi:MAG: transporter substrate-binding protein [Bacillales bacterium]|jgi:hypothetical protein|nr:transporter substrate-binding protein [Bacillales bacterium]